MRTEISDFASATIHARKSTVAFKFQPDSIRQCLIVTIEVETLTTSGILRMQQLLICVVVVAVMPEAAYQEIFLGLAESQSGTLRVRGKSGQVHGHFPQALNSSHIWFAMK